MVLAFAFSPVIMISMTEVARPIQLNSRALYWTPWLPSASSSAAAWETMPMAVPSLGATEVSQFASLKLPAPGMDCATTVGLPGICLPMWRAMRWP